MGRRPSRYLSTGVWNRGGFGHAESRDGGAARFPWAECDTGELAVAMTLPFTSGEACPYKPCRGVASRRREGWWRMSDLLITGGTVVDGTGAPERRADVAISGGLVSAVGDLAGRSAARVLSADGCVVCPGFVDVHTHSDLTLLSSPSAH